MLFFCSIFLKKSLFFLLIYQLFFFFFSKRWWSLRHLSLVLLSTAKIRHHSQNQNNQHFHTNSSATASTTRDYVMTTVDRKKICVILPHPVEFSFTCINIRAAAQRSHSIQKLVKSTNLNKIFYWWNMIFGSYLIHMITEIKKIDITIENKIFR